MSTPAHPGPHARSESRIAFARGADGYTFVCDQEVRYPLHVTAPFRLAESPPGLCTLYLQSVSGGLYDGDDVTLSLACGEGAAAHLTTQSPGVVHAARAGGAIQRVDVTVGADALFEFLPDPVVMFPSAVLRSRIEATVAPGATLLVADGLLAHDPAGAARHWSLWDSQVRLRDDGGRLLVHERLRLEGADRLERASGPGGVGACQASLVCARPGDDPQPLLVAAREALAGCTDVYAGASTLPNDAGVLVRMASAEADRLAAAMLAAWSALRLRLTGEPPAPRRK